MANKGVNENCLIGWRCPECGEAEGFTVEVVRAHTVYLWSTSTPCDSISSRLALKYLRCLYDSGTEDKDYGDTDWEDWSGVVCGDCQHAGTAFDFTHTDESLCQQFHMLRAARARTKANLDKWVTAAIDPEKRERPDIFEVGTAFMSLMDVEGELKKLSGA